MKTPDSLRRIPDERVSAILTRAAELDKQVQASVELDAIRAAAVEAGISLSAVDRALEEYAAGTTDMAEPSVTAPPPRQPGLLRRWFNKVSDVTKYAVLGFLMGGLAALGEAGIMVPIIGLLLVAGHIIIQDRPARSVRRFLLLLSTTMIASLTMYMLGEGADEDVVAYIMMIWAALVPFGVVAIKTVPRKAPLEAANTTS